MVHFARTNPRAFAVTAPLAPTWSVDIAWKWQKGGQI